MPLHYDGIEVPKAGLTIRIESTEHGQTSTVTRPAHGWVRLIVRATRAPALQFSVQSNQEALPEHVADVSLSIQHMQVNVGDDELRDFTFAPAAFDPAMRVAFWTTLIAAPGELRDIHLEVSRLDARKAEIEFTARTATLPDSLIVVAGHARIVAPDSVVSRAAFAMEDRGWLVLPNSAGCTVNGNWDLHDGDLEDLGASPTVRSVDLEDNAHLSDSGIYALSRLPNLETALLSGTNVYGIGLKALGSLRKFHHIEVNRTPFTDQGLFCLEGRPLTGFGASDTRVTDEGVRTLSPQSLRSLLLSNTDVTDAAFAAFLVFPHLEILGLAGTKISDVLMSRLPTLCPNLQNLAIAGTAVTEAAVPFIAALPKLKWVVGGIEALGTAGAGRLRQVRPDISL